MKNIALLAALLVPYCVSASATGSFDFDIPEKSKNAASKADITVVKPDQVKVESAKPRVSVVMPVEPPAKPVTAVVAKPVIPVEVKPVVPVEVKPALSLPTTVAKSTPAASTVAPLKPAPVTKPSASAVAKAAPAVVAAVPLVSKEVYKAEEVSKNAPKAVVKDGKLCSPTTIAMTFHNVPTQKGPYFHRWVSLGCEADEVNFVREGNEQYSMHWKLSYVPADAQETARYALVWKVKGKDVKGAPVDYEARHTFNLDNARTLSLTNNMAVSLRKVP